ALGLEHRSAHEIEERVHPLGLERLREQLRAGDRSHGALRVTSRWLRRYPNSAPVSSFAGVRCRVAGRGARETLLLCDFPARAGSAEWWGRSRRGRPRSRGPRLPPRFGSRGTRRSAWSGRRRGRKVNGYVYNQPSRYAARMSLLVEGVDASGTVVAATPTWVPDVPPNNRAYFQVAVPDAPSYRITIVSYNWIQEIASSSDRWRAH